MAYGPNAHICDPLNIFQIGMVMMVYRSEKNVHFWNMFQIGTVQSKSQLYVSHYVSKRIFRFEL